MRIKHSNLVVSLYAQTFLLVHVKTRTYYAHNADSDAGDLHCKRHYREYLVSLRLVKMDPLELSFIMVQT